MIVYDITGNEQEHIQGNNTKRHGHSHPLDHHPRHRRLGRVRQARLLGLGLRGRQPRHQDRQDSVRPLGRHRDLLHERHQARVQEDTQRAGAVHPLLLRDQEDLQGVPAATGLQAGVRGRVRQGVQQDRGRHARRRGS